jgi:hypothetical protein
LLESRWEIFDKPAAGGRIQNGECACDIKVPARGFSASAEIIHQEHVGFKLQGQNDRVALTCIEICQARIWKGSGMFNLQPIGAITNPFLTLGGVASS